MREWSEEELRARHQRSRAYFQRARAVIPGGTHLSGRPLVDSELTPMYFERASGCRIWDVDGHEYVDLLMAFGAYLIGYAHPEVEAAAFEKAKLGRLLSLNHPAHIRFIEQILSRFAGMEMGVFFRSGSDATTAALRIARRATGRRRIARCGYHGFHDWCLPLEDYVPSGLEDQVLEFQANTPETLRALFAAYPGQIAAVILAPEMVLPFEPASFHTLQEIAHKHGAVFVMDEVKTALRIAPGTISARAGIVPDLMTVSKALGNGFSIAALLGRQEVMRAGDGMHYSATFQGDISAMAAAHKVLELCDAHDVASHVASLGKMLIDGLNALILHYELPAHAFGEPLEPMPFMRFNHEDQEANARLSKAFYCEMLARGVLLHPRHMWFISLAHTPQDIAFVLEAAEAAFRVARRKL